MAQHAKVSIKPKDPSPSQGLIWLKQRADSWQLSSGLGTHVPPFNINGTKKLKKYYRWVFNHFTHYD